MNEMETHLARPDEAPADVRRYGSQPSGGPLHLAVFLLFMFVTIMVAGGGVRFLTATLVPEPFGLDIAPHLVEDHEPLTPAEARNPDAVREHVVRYLPFSPGSEEDLAFLHRAAGAVDQYARSVDTVQRLSTSVLVMLGLAILAFACSQVGYRPRDVLFVYIPLYGFMIFIPMIVWRFASPVAYWKQDPAQRSDATTTTQSLLFAALLAVITWGVVMLLWPLVRAF